MLLLSSTNLMFIYFKELKLCYNF